MTALSHALALAEQGVPCFPCLASKAPGCPKGFKAATADPAALRALWDRYPGPLVGVPTGPASGMDALDIDPRHGGDAWEREQASRLTPTRVHATRSGGRHYLFRHHAGVRNSANAIAPGIDVRAEGGYIVWWPADCCPVLNNAAVTPWPAWLLAQLLSKPQQAPGAPYQRGQLPSDAAMRPQYANGALRNAIRRVASAGEGCRNDTLNSETFSLARFTRDGSLTAGEIADAMAAAGLAAGLEAREVAATIASALAGGVAP